ncbi:MAG: hypothetical protein IJ513_00015 [Bacteroidaceae bacterium]|nr:hypothetical protein [Bacteroidaceae bacterium]
MKIKNLFLKWMSEVIIIVTFIAYTPGFAQQSMSLGDLKFVMPSQEVMRSSRTLHMKMARTGISARFIAKVGGVAFIQTAEPNLKIETISLGINQIQNNAYVIINDTIYDIPLEVWELQSIVDYADQEENAAVTLFGDSEAKIKYHEAFLDNLMGLRILQTDLMLTGFLPPKDRWKLPSDQNGRFILSPNEDKEYNDWCEIDSLLFGLPYDVVSLWHSYKVMQAMDSISEPYDTYIYTDYDQPITFDCKNNKILFEGKPYYRFALRDSLLVDTLEMYYELRNFVETFNICRNKYKDLSISNIFKKSKSPTIDKILKLSRKNNKIQEKAIKAFELTNYYAMCDSFGFNDDNRVMNYLYPEILRAKIELFSDSIAKKGSNNADLYKICKEFTLIKDSLGHYDYPIITEYVNIMHNLIPDDSVINMMYEFSREYNLTYDRLLIEHMYNNRIPAAIIQENTTNYLRKNRVLTYMINPIVFNAAEKTCQWSAFFRYLKEYHDEEWNTFVNDIKKLKYDAPIVQTPIDFVNGTGY